MEKNKSILIFLILIGICLVIYSMHLFVSRTELDQPIRSVLVKQDNEYLVRFDLTNTETEDMIYTLSVIVDGKRYNENILLKPGKILTYKHHIYMPLKDNRVTVSVYQGNKTIPVSENIYTLGAV